MPPGQSRDRDGLHSELVVAPGDEEENELEQKEEIQQLSLVNVLGRAEDAQKTDEHRIESMETRAATSTTEETFQTVVPIDGPCFGSIDGPCSADSAAEVQEESIHEASRIELQIISEGSGPAVQSKVRAQTFCAQDSALTHHTHRSSEGLRSESFQGPMRKRLQAQDYSMDDDAEDFKNGISVPLPLLSRHSVASNLAGCCGFQKCCTPLLEAVVAMTPEETGAFKRLSQLASIQLDEENPRHESAMKQYWFCMMGDDVPYEARSPRWSDDLGFQSATPWTDFRGGGLLALRCLLYLGQRHTEQAHQLAEAAKYSLSPAWYPFSAVGITICQMLAVHLRLHARPAIGPIRGLPRAHVLALKRFVRDLSKGDPVAVFARFWLAALLKLHTEWLDICRRDPKANVLVSFNGVYRYLGIALESTFSWSARDRLSVMASVDPCSRWTGARNTWSRATVSIFVGLLSLEDVCCCRRRRPVANTSAADAAMGTVKPPEQLSAKDVYQLYRGVGGNVEDGRDCWEGGRMWVDFTTLQLRWASKDAPALSSHRLSLFSITWCQCKMNFAAFDATSSQSQLDIYGRHSFGQKVLRLQMPASILKPQVSLSGPFEGLQEFLQALQQLLECRDAEGHGVLHFVQKRLFQYLWMNQSMDLSQDELHEAQAVLAFNLHPKTGIAYLKEKCHKDTDDEVGEWLAHVCMERGGLDPAMLGDYFSRKDILPIFWSFVRRSDFRGLDILDALRQLFDTFKPGGEGQVITRILEYFAEAYFEQWQQQDNPEPPTAFANPDSVLQVAVSLIMLNTGIHIVPQKTGKKDMQVMTVEQYISNTRLCVAAEEVPDEACRFWYDKVSRVQISVEPMPRAPFSKLPVQPDIEGRLIAVLDAETQKRYWAVLVLRRLYLFNDNSDVEPADVIDLKDLTVRSVSEDQAASHRFRNDLRGNSSCFSCCARRNQRSKVSSEFVDECLNAEDRALEISQETSEPSLLQASCKKPRARLSLIAESQDLAEKWVNLICI